MATSPKFPPLEPLPPSLSSALGKLVYLAVRGRGETTVVELRDLLDEPQLRLYPTIDALADAGLVELDGETVRPLVQASAGRVAGD